MPLNPNRVLDKLPIEECEEGQMQNVLIYYLRQQRFLNTPSRRNKKRTKLVAEPGEYTTAQDSHSSSSKVRCFIVATRKRRNLILEVNRDEM